MTTVRCISVYWMNCGVNVDILQMNVRFSVFSWTTLLRIVEQIVQYYPHIPLSTTTISQDYYKSIFTRERRPRKARYRAGRETRREDTGYEEDEVFCGERGQCRNHSCEVVQLCCLLLWQRRYITSSTSTTAVLCCSGPTIIGST